MKSQTVIPLKQVTGIADVGGKAAALGELMRAGFNVPRGFVITTSSNMRMSKELEVQILKNFNSLDAKRVAVRSSGVAEDSKDAAWAGQFDTFLNTDRDHLVENVKKCWASAKSKRAQAYAKEKGLRSGSVAVIVQEMVPSEIAGVVFSVHPVTQDKNQIVVEAVRGLGEQLVSGAVTPDTYIFDKSSHKILQKHISDQTKKLMRGSNGKNQWQKIGSGNKQKLSDSQISELAKTVIELEVFFGFPVDVEWAIASKQLYILQSRSITTL